MKMKRSIILVTFLGTFALFAQNKKVTKPQLVKEIFITQLLSKMTLEEKIGQLNLPTAGDITTGQASSSDVAKKIEEGQVGGLFNIKSVKKIREVQKIAVEKRMSFMVMKQPSQSP
jgi:beta-glucosidase